MQPTSDRRFSTELSGLGGATLAIETALLASGFHASALGSSTLGALRGEGESASSVPSPLASDRRFSTELSGLGGATLAIETALLASGFHASALGFIILSRRTGEGREGGRQLGGEG